MLETFQINVYSFFCTSFVLFSVCIESYFMFGWFCLHRSIINSTAINSNELQPSVDFPTTDLKLVQFDFEIWMMQRYIFFIVGFGIIHRLRRNNSMLSISMNLLIFIETNSILIAKKNTYLLILVHTFPRNNLHFGVVYLFWPWIFSQLYA